MQNKNILFLVISMNKGGAERVVSILLRHLEHKKDVKAYLVMMESGIAYDLPSNIEPVVLFKGKKGGIRKFLELPFVAFQVAKFAKQNKINTIVSFLYRPNYVNILTKLFGFRGQSIINIRSTTSRYLNEGLQGKINLFLINRLFNKADLIISNSNGVKDDLDSLINTTTKHIAIPNPIDIKMVETLKKLPLEKEIEIDSDYIVSVGRLIPLKRNKDLIKAFSLVHKKIPKAKLLFLGDGDLKDDLKTFSKDLGIEKKVVFLGNVNNPFSYLAKSKLFVMTSEIEGFPNVLIEAMACGLPVISSDCKSGPSEILEDDKYGLLFEVGDIEALSIKILELMMDESKREFFMKKSIERAKEYDVEKIITKFEREIL